MESKHLTDYDLLIYFTNVFTLNPSKFYLELKSKIKNNPNIVPLISQEYASKIAKAIENPQFREIIKYAYDKSNCKLPLLTNSLILPGIAGSGKTSVVLQSVNNPTEHIIVGGPTDSQAIHLKGSLNRDSFYTFKSLLENILGTQQFTDISTEFENLDNTKSDIIQSISGKFFS
jgi:hypothetical protein